MRRGHGSSKVPNVKLRPVPQRVSSSRASSSKRPSGREHDEDVDMTEDGAAEEESLLLQRQRRPLTGVNLTFTGVKGKTDLTREANQLGASVSSDFTDRVTHLLACVSGSAKYQCALERRIPIMDPAWITETHEQWLKGEDISLEETVENYRLPPLIGFCVVITGETDLKRRQKIGQAIRACGGRYEKDIGERVTHILCCSEDALQSSEKLAWAQKTNATRRKAGASDKQLVHIVWEEWLWDCKEWEGAWNESGYVYDNPRPSRRPLPLPSFMEDLSFNCETSTQKPVEFEKASGSSELPTTTADDQRLEIAKVRRPGDSGMGIKAKLDKRLWDEISSISQSVASDITLGRSTVPSEAGDDDRTKKRRRISNASDDTESEKEGLPDLAALRVKKLAESTLSTSSSALAKVSNSRANLFVDAGPSRQMQRVASTTGFSKRPLPSVNETPVARVFAGLRFRTLGQASLDILVGPVEENGGIVIKSQPSDNLEDADYIVVRLQEAATFCTKNHPLFIRFRTECWVESCMFQERLCEAGEHVAYAPLSITVPLAGAETISLVWSGLDNSQTYPLRRLCKTLGVNLPDTFSPKTTHLICPVKTGPKAERAKQWGIPVLDLEWLWNAAKTGVFEGTVMPKVAGPIVDITNASSSSASSHHSASGKGISSDTASKRSTTSAPMEDIFGQPDHSVFSGEPQAPRSPLKARIRAIVSPTKSDIATAPTSPAERARTLVGSPGPVNRKDSARSSASLSALLSKHSKDSLLSESDNVPPRKKTRPATKARALGQSTSGTLSPVSAPLPLSITSPVPPEDVEESMRVLYNDPADFAEKQRLMALLNGEPDSVSSTASATSSTNGPRAKPALRRSTRMAGF